MLCGGDSYHFNLGGRHIGYNLGVEGARAWNAYCGVGADTLENRQGRAGHLADDCGHSIGAFDAYQGDSGSTHCSAFVVWDLMRFDTYKLCGAAILCAVAVFILRHIKKEFEVPLTIAGGLILILAAFGIGKPVFEYISDLMSSSPIIGEAAGILMRVVGIAVVTRISADICREMGSASVAAALETVAKFEIILLSLPLVSSVLESVKTLFSEAGF